MNRPIDYTELAAKLDYAALDKKLTQLAQAKPPKQRKTVADVLEPLREALLALHHKGWRSGQLVDELKAVRVPVSPARLRECLNRWAEGGAGVVKSPAGRRRQRATMDARPITAANQVARSQSASGDGQTGLRLPGH